MLAEGSPQSYLDFVGLKGLVWFRLGFFDFCFLGCGGVRF